jgi:DNA repair photolyase
MKNQKDPTACPIGCRYCVITQVDYRREQWEKRFVIGVNKAVTILNPPSDKENKEAMKQFYGFPLEILEGDIVGFNAISDPFWPKYAEELQWFLKQVAPIAKAITCVTKFQVPEALMRQLASIENFQLNVSITGLDAIEKSGTKSRLRTLELAQKHGVRAFPTIHPYVGGMSNLSFLPKLKAMGYDYVDIKGLRYDPSMACWMPESSQALYRGSEGEEVLVEDGWRELVADAGLKVKPLRIWNAANALSSPSLTRLEAESRVARLLTYANITSSDSDEAVVEAAIQRRL